MADYSVGDITARLRADSTQFDQALQQAQQRLRALTDALAQQRTAQAGAQQSTSQLSQAILTLSRSVSEQTQAYTQVQATVTAYRREQDALREALRRQREEQQAASAAASQASGVLRGMLSVAGGIGIATTIGQLATAIKNTAVEAVNLASRMQDLHLSFRAIEGSTEAANSRMSALFNTAQRLGVDFVSITESFRRFDAAAQGTALQGAGVGRAFEGIVAGARALGSSGAELDRALVALSQSLSKGRLQAEELRGQLAEAIPNALRLMAEGLGVTVGTLNSLVQTGFLPADAAVIALAESMRKLGEQAGTGSEIDRMASVFARLKNETTAWLTALGDGINTVLRPFLQELTQLSEQLRNVFNIPLPGQQGARAPTAMPATTPQAYAALIAQEAGPRQLDPGLLARLIQAESGFNPQAVSRAGAVGLGQLLPSTARELQPGVTEAQLREPATNIRLSAEYLSRLMQTFRNDADQVPLALAAYNAGLGRVTDLINAEARRLTDEARRASGGQALTLAQQRDIQRRSASFAAISGQLPAETQAYVTRITGALPGLAQAGAATPVPGAPGAAAAMGAGEGAMAAGVPEAMLKGIEDTLKTIPQLQQQFENLRTSELNAYGGLSETFTKQADEAIDKFRGVASLLAQFPELQQKMTAEQRQQAIEAARLVAIFQAQVEEETQTEANARKRIAVFAEMGRLEEALAKEQIQDQERYQEAVDKVTMSLATQQARALETLATLQAKYIQRPEQTDLEKVTAIREQFVGDAAITARAKDVADIIATRDAYNLEIAALNNRFTALKQNADAQRDLEDATAKWSLTARSTLEQLQLPREERKEARLRVEAERAGVTLTPAQEAMLEQITAQERFNETWRVTETVITNAASTITAGLMSIVTATSNVSTAFKQMAVSILRSTGEILVNEGVRQLLRIGLGALGGALAPTAPGALGPGQPGLEALFGGPTTATPYTLAPVGAGPSNVFAFQHGGVVQKPTLSLVGEAGPEAVVNRSQMAGLLDFARSAGPAAGGQAMGQKGITIINVSSAAEGERQAANERSMGREVVVNQILTDIGRGEASQIVRALRTVQR